MLQGLHQVGAVQSPDASPVTIKIRGISLFSCGRTPMPNLYTRSNPGDLGRAVSLMALGELTDGLQHKHGQIERGLAIFARDNGTRATRYGVNEGS